MLAHNDVMAELKIFLFAFQRFVLDNALLEMNKTYQVRLRSTRMRLVRVQNEFLNFLIKAFDGTAHRANVGGNRSGGYRHRRRFGCKQHPRQLFSVFVMSALQLTMNWAKGL